MPVMSMMKPMRRGAYEVAIPGGLNYAHLKGRRSLNSLMDLRLEALIGRIRTHSSDGSVGSQSTSDQSWFGQCQAPAVQPELPAPLEYVHGR